MIFLKYLQVIDMCAAPGSKTAQLIEMMHSDEGKMPGIRLKEKLHDNLLHFRYYKKFYFNISLIYFRLVV